MTVFKPRYNFFSGVEGGGRFSVLVIPFSINFLLRLGNEKWEQLDYCL